MSGITSGQSEQGTFRISQQDKQSKAREVELVHQDVSRSDQESPEGYRLSLPGPCPDSGPEAPLGQGKGGSPPASTTHIDTVFGQTFLNTHEDVLYITAVLSFNYIKNNCV